MVWMVANAPASSNVEGGTSYGGCVYKEDGEEAELGEVPEYIPASPKANKETLL